jgi:hypothetical protein
MVGQHNVPTDPIVSVSTDAGRVRITVASRGGGSNPENRTVISPETIGNWLVALVVGISASAITFPLSSYRERKLHHRVDTYLAMQIAITLEAFAIACFDLVSENERAQPTDDDEGPRKTMPPLARYPGGIDWRTLDAGLANRVLALRNDLAVSASTMYFEWSISSESQSDLCNEQAAKKGVQAWDLAHELRSRYSLDEYSPGYDLRGKLQKFSDDLRARDEARSAAAQAMIDEIPDDRPK